MTTPSVKSEDRLEGASNFNTWKARVLNILEESDLDDLVTRVVEEPTTAQGRATFKKKQAKAKQVIFDLVKDNLMAVLAPLRTAKECFDALANLYEKKAPTQRRVLKKQLRSVRMEKDEKVATFFSKIAQIRDQLLAIGDKVEDNDLVQTVFDGLPTTWETFLASVNGRGDQPNFERLWHDCLNEGSKANSCPHQKIIQLYLSKQRKERIPYHTRTIVRNLEVSISLNQELSVIIVVSLVIMHGSVENHLTKIGIERNTMFQLLQKKSNLNKRGLRLKPRIQVKEKNITWPQHFQVPPSTFQIPGG